MKQKAEGLKKFEILYRELSDIKNTNIHNVFEMKKLVIEWHMRDITQRIENLEVMFLRFSAQHNK